MEEEIITSLLDRPDWSALFAYGLVLVPTLPHCRNMEGRRGYGPSAHCGVRVSVGYVWY